MNSNETIEMPSPNLTPKSAAASPASGMPSSPTEQAIQLMRLQERAQVIVNKLTYVRPMTPEQRDFLTAELCQIEEQISTF